MDARFFNIDINKLVFGVQCKYFNIVNKKKYSTLYAKVDG